MTFNLFFHDFFLEPSIPAEYWYIEALRILVRVMIGVLVILLAVPFLVWWERRLLGWMQQRQGPNRVGPFGLLQTIADGVKLLFKEDMNPTDVDKVLFVLAPMVFLIPALVTGGVIPWGPSKTWGAAAPNVNIGVLYMLAWGSLGVYGIVLAGWASNNKYSLLGGLRSSAQMISYELAMGLAVITVVLLSGSTGMQDIVERQGFVSLSPSLDHLGIALPAWNLFKYPPMGLIAMMIYGISMFAETNRAPFDLPEAETELVAGYHTEYTSMKFATFFLGEYANMVIVSAICATLFFGGYHAPLPVLEGATIPATTFFNKLVIALLPAIWFIFKTMCGLYFFIWVRATLPRLRYDMLMRFGWMGLLPIGLANILLVAVGLALNWQISLIGGIVLFIIALMAGASTVVSKKFTANTRRNASIVLNSSAQPYRVMPVQRRNGLAAAAAGAESVALAVSETGHESEVEADGLAVAGKKG